MAPKKFQKFIGYNGPSNTIISVPAKIKCSRCNKVKGSASYSNNRLEELKYHALRNSKFNPTVQTLIPCSECTGGQRLEHTCIDCGKTKATDTGFTRSQLKRGDDALCIKCSDKLNSLGVGGVEDDEDEDGSGSEVDLQSDDGEDDEWGSTTASGMGGVAIRSGTGTTGSTFPAARGLPPLSSSFVPAGSDRTSTVSTASGLPPGFNPRAYGKPKSMASGPRGGNPGFAKIRKTKPLPDRYWEKGVSTKGHESEDEDEDEDDIAIHSDGSD